MNPAAIFTSTIAWNPERIGALAIYCSDGRWGEAFDEFCHVCLDIPRYDRFAVPGGPAWLTLRNASLTRPYDVARTQLNFLVEVHRLERIVLITHYGCAFYADLLGQPPEDCLSSQLTDLRTAGGNLRGWFGALELEGYVAMQKGDRLSFYRVDID